MGYAKYVGRVGALAVALGIGTAVANPAWADAPAPDTEPSSTGVQSPASAGPDRSTALSERTPSSDVSELTTNVESDEEDEEAVEEPETAVSDEDSDDDFTEDTSTPQVAEPIDEKDDQQAGRTSADNEPQTTRSTSAHDSAVTGPPVEQTQRNERSAPDRPPASLTDTSQGPASLTDTSQGEDGGESTKPTNTRITTTQLPSRTYQPPTADVLATVSNDAPAPAPFARQPKTPLGLVLGGPVAMLDIAVKALNMLFSAAPTMPGDPPLLLGVLAFVRREVNRTFFNSSPIAVSDTVGTSEGIPTRISVLDNDTDRNVGDVLTVSSYTQAADGVVALNPDGSFTYTPNAGFVGTDSFTYRVSDEASPWHVHSLASVLRGEHASTATVKVTVNAVGSQTPTAGDDSVMTAEDNPIVIDVLANDSAADGDTISVSGVGAPAHGTATVAGGKITYTPGTDYHGPDSFTYTITDGTATDSATVTVTITPVNDAPKAIDDVATVGVHSSTFAAEDLVGNDSDPDVGDQLSVASVASAANGTVVLNGDGTVTFTPTAGYTGPASFTYRSKDASGTMSANAALVSLTVVPSSNGAPVAGETVLDPADVRTGAVTGRVTATDPDGGAVVFSGPTATPNGRVVVNDDGTFTYSPMVTARLRAANTTAVDSFVVTAEDGAGQKTSIVVTVAIDPARNAVETVITAGGSLTGATMSPDGRWLYVADASNRSVRLIDTVTGSAVGEPIPVGNTPTAITSGADGKHLYVLTVDVEDYDGFLVVVDTETRKAVANPISVGSLPSAIHLDARGERIFVTSALDNTVAIVDLVTGNVVGSPISVGKNPLAMATSLDADTLYVANAGDGTISIIDTRTRSIAGAPLDIGGTPYAIVTSAGGHRLYVADLGDGTVSVVDVETGAVTKVEVGNSPDALAMSDDGTRLYVSSSTSNSVTIVDTETNAVLGAPISVGQSPIAVLIGNSGTHDYTVNADGTISVLSTVPSVGSPIATAPATPQVDPTTGVVTGALEFAAQDGGPLTLSLTRAPKYGTVVLNSDGTYSYTPTSAARHASGASALGLSDDFVVSAHTSTGAAAVQTVTIAIDPVSPAKLLGTVAPWLRGFQGVMSPDGSRIYASAENRFAVIDSATGTILHTVEDASFWGGSAIAVTPDGQRAYVAVTSFVIQVIDTGYRGSAPSVTPSVIGSIPIPYTTGSYTGVNVVASPDGKYIYVPKQWAGTYVIDAQTNTMIDVNPQTEETIDPIPTDAVGLPTLSFNRDATLVFSADNRSNTVHVVDTDTFHIIRTVAVDGNVDGPVLVSRDGRRAYTLSSGTGTISVIDLESYDVTTVKIGDDLTYLASPVLTPDGTRLYIPGFHDIYIVDTSGESPNVVGKIVSPTPGAGEESNIDGLALSTDGSRLYIVGSSAGIDGSAYVSVVNTATDALIGSPLRIADISASLIGLSPDGRTLATHVWDDRVWAIAVVDTGTSNPPPPQPSEWSTPRGPSTVEELWANLQRYAQGNHDTDGIFIQTVKGVDDHNRMIVYLGGTTLDNPTDQAWWENLPSYAGVTKSDQVDAINEVLEYCGANASCGSIDEIMLVGFSQGGIDAQNLAFWNFLGGATGQQDRVPVSAVLTFGSPITVINPGSSIHIQDTADEVVNYINVGEVGALIALPAPLKIFLAARKATALARGEIYADRAPTPTDNPLFGVHTNYETYRYLANEFWNSSSGHEGQKDAIAPFFGGRLVDAANQEATSTWV